VAHSASSRTSKDPSNAHHLDPLAFGLFVVRSPGVVSSSSSCSRLARRTTNASIRPSRGVAVVPLRLRIPTPRRASNARTVVVVVVVVVVVTVVTVVVVVVVVELVVVELVRSFAASSNAVASKSSWCLKTKRNRRPATKG
jgi:hypothetical protein